MLFNFKSVDLFQLQRYSPPSFPLLVSLEREKNDRQTDAFLFAGLAAKHAIRFIADFVVTGLSIQSNWLFCPGTVKFWVERLVRTLTRDQAKNRCFIFGSPRSVLKDPH